MLNTGKYRCVAMENALGETKNGNAQFALRFRVVGEYDPNGTLYGITPVERTLFQVLNSNTMSFAVEILRALGYTYNTLGPLNPESPNRHNFDGFEFDGWCSHTNNLKGEPKEDWSVARGRGELTAGKAMDPKKLRALDDLFGIAVKNLGAQPAAAPARPKLTPAEQAQGIVSRPRGSAAAVADPPPFRGPQEISDDDVPF